MLWGASLNTNPADRAISTEAVSESPSLIASCSLNCILLFKLRPALKIASSFSWRARSQKDRLQPNSKKIIPIGFSLIWLKPGKCFFLAKAAPGSRRPPAKAGGNSKKRSLETLFKIERNAFSNDVGFFPPASPDLRTSAQKLSSDRDPLSNIRLVL